MSGKEYHKEYYIKNKKKIQEYQNQYNKNHVEERKEYQKEYAINNRDALNEYHKDYYYKIQEKSLAYQKEYNNNKKEEIKEYQKEYYLKRKEQKVKKEKSLIPLPKYLLDKIEAVIKKKLKQYTRTLEKEVIVILKIENKYYEKKKMMKYQYSLPQAEPFSEFTTTERGFLLKW
jgi:hypothetical protein